MQNARTEKTAEGKSFLTPLLDALGKAKVEKVTRATSKAKAKPAPATPPESPPG